MSDQFCRKCGGEESACVNCTQEEAVRELRALFVKYIALILDQEGIDYIGHGFHPATRFVVAEEARLEPLVKEAHELLDGYRL